MIRQLRILPRYSSSAEKLRYSSSSAHFISTTPQWHHYEVRGRGHRCGAETSVRDFIVQTDTPRAAGGNDKFPQPVELLLAALIGCEQATAHFVAQKMRPRITIDHMDFSLKARRDQRGALSMTKSRDIQVPPSDAVPSHLQEIKGEVRVYTQSSQSEVDALAMQVHTRCPVASMVHASGCKLDIEWIREEPA